MNTNQTKTNNRITAKELRVIGADGANLGVISLEAALQAAAQAGLDLIEVSPNAQPPVARIMSFDKYRYELNKKLKKQQALQKNKDMKQVQISIRAAKNDLDIKVKKVEEFLTEGHPVVIVMVLRGREKGMKDFAREKLRDFLKMITVEYRALSEPKIGGRGMVIHINKK